jgi:hypothetical protein
MTERQLVNVLESQVTESEASNYEVGEQRERNHRYYTLQPLGNEIDGRSQYISPDVLDSVEAKKAFFSETFFSGRKVVKFSPMGDGDSAEADKRTAYVNMQYERNDVFCMFRDGWHDAFVAKRMTVCAVWKEDTEQVTINVQGANQQQLQVIVSQQGDVVNVNTDQLQPDEQQANQAMQPGQQPQQGTFTGPIIIDIDTSHVDLKLVQPERVFRDPNATYVQDGQYFTYEEDLTRGELILQGVDPEQAEKLTVDYRFRSEEEDNARKSHDNSWTRRQQHKRADEQELITTYYTWTWIDATEFDLDEMQSDTAGGGTGNASIDPEGLGLYRIRWAHGEVLIDTEGNMMIEEATEIPAFEWTEFKISHAEHGLADADLVAHSQRTQSTLKRLIIDNQQMRNTTRYEAVQGAIKNPRELLDNSIGGVIWSRSIGSVQALPTPELSPLTMAVVEMIDQDKEERSGVSRLSKGMNNDALRYQNAADMVERLTNASQMRVMRAARDFAESFHVPLSKYIYRLGARHDKRTHSKEVAGKFETIMPASWPDMDMSMEVSVALTPDAGQKHAQMLIQMYNMQVQDPTLMLAFGYAQKHALLDDIYDHLGVADTSRYLLAPDSEEYQRKQKFQAEQQQKQQQAQQKQQQMAQAMQKQQMQMQMDETQFKQWLEKSEDGREWMLAQLKKVESGVKNQDIASDNMREDEKMRWDKVTDMLEYDLEKTQERGAAI